MFIPHFSIEESLVRNLAKSWNNLDTQSLSPNLHPNMIYMSQWVVRPIYGKNLYLQYLQTKFVNLKKARFTLEINVKAELAFHPALMHRPCIVLTQTFPESLIKTCMFIKVDAGQIRQINLCHTPSPYSAVLTGEIPF